MTKTMTLAIAAVATSLAAGPVFAKDTTNTTTTSERQVTKPQKMKVSKADRQARRQMRLQEDANASYERGFSNGFDRRAQIDRGYDRTVTYDNRSDDRGFWPADVAGNVVGGAVTTAGAIATAPFRDTYAAYDTPVVNSGWNDTYYDSGWNNSWNNNWNNNWARRQQGGFICTPGTWYTNSYGYTQLCQ